jgi:hypothetical protein
VDISLLELVDGGVRNKIKIRRQEFAKSSKPSGLAKKRSLY